MCSCSASLHKEAVRPKNEAVMGMEGNANKMVKCRCNLPRHTANNPWKSVGNGEVTITHQHIFANGVTGTHIWWIIAGRQSPSDKPEANVGSTPS